MALFIPKEFQREILDGGQIEYVEIIFRREMDKRSS